MNKLDLSTPGGIPLSSDSFEFQNGNEGGFEGAIKSLLHQYALQKNGNAILWGCEVFVSGSELSISEGWVLLDYEPMYLPAIDTIMLSHDFSIVRNISWINSVALQDGGSVAIHNKRIAKIEFNSNDSIRIPLNDDSYNITTIIRNNVQAVDIQIVSAITNGFSVPFGSNFKILKTSKVVHFAGQLLGKHYQGGSQVFLLNQVFRPLQNLTFICFASIGSYVTVNINPSGFVTTESSNTTDIITVDFSSICYIVP